MAPPPKRRRRNVVPSSSPSENDDEPARVVKARLSNSSSLPVPLDPEERPSMAGRAPIEPEKQAVRGPVRAKTANHPHNAAPIYLPKQARGSKASSKSASSSPEKSKRKAKIEEKGKSGDIFTFFTKQAQRQQLESTGLGVPVRPRVPRQSSKESKAEDLDAISDEDDFVESKSQSSSVVGLAARKRTRGLDNFKNDDGDIPSPSQKFLKAPKPPVLPKSEDDTRPWAERFAPMNLDELAVHKKKVSDVRSWLEEVMSARMRQRILILKGSAGTGKTTTVKLLAKAMDYDVLEWRNPVGAVASADGFQSMSGQFEEFLGRGGKFGQLDIFSSSEPAPSRPESKPLDRRKSLILIEEFPNTFVRSSTALQSFRSAILQYLASNTPPLSMMYKNISQDPVTPVVMVVSETLLTTTSASADSFTAHRLLGPEILQHPGVGIIEFNPIAPTLLAKALEIIVQKESRKSGRRKTPGPLVLKKLGEIGDIRSATGSLEFLCLRGDVDGNWGAKVSFAKTKKASKDLALTKMEEESLELVTRREASLGIFHAIGKVVYNKRDEAAPSFSSEKDVEKLPSFMSIHSRPKRSQVAVDELIDETGTDTDTFISALHENYILSCDAPATSFELTSMDHVNGCIDSLSDSDLLCPSWDGSLNSTSFGGGVGGNGTGGDILRQDEIAFQIAVRGILFSLPDPVKRITTSTASGLRTGKGGEAHKMFYPTSLKLWRTREENESMIDLWVTRLMKGDDEHLHDVTSGASAFSRPKVVESWKSVRSDNPSTKKSASKEPHHHDAPLLSIGTSARKEMLLERLPYMVLIAKSRKLNSLNLTIRDMEKVTAFRGIGITSVDEAEEEIEGIEKMGEDWATDKPVEEGTSPRKTRKGKGVRFMGGKGEEGAMHLQEQKLVLSDDDIEDD